MAQTAALRIVYLFEDGQTSDLALGTIDRSGVIETSVVADGEEDKVAALVAELNGLDRVFVQEMVDGPEGESGRRRKIPVERGTAEFLTALQSDAERFYSVALRFDPAVLTEEDDGMGLDWPDMPPPEPPIPGAGSYGPETLDPEEEAAETGLPRLDPEG